MRNISASILQVVARRWWHCIASWSEIMLGLMSSCFHQGIV
jgi:hypothetical protein